MWHSEFYVRTCRARFLFRRQDFCWDNLTSQLLQICFLFIRLCNFKWSACVTSFFTLIGASFLFIRVKKFLVTRDLPHSQKWLPRSKIDFYFTLIQRDKVKWLCVTLIGGYLRALNRSSLRINKFLIKIKSQRLKKAIFWSVSSWDCRSTKLLWLFSGNLPAMFYLFLKRLISLISHFCLSSYVDSWSLFYSPLASVPVTIYINFFVLNWFKFINASVLQLTWSLVSNWLLLHLFFYLRLLF